jgi:hypothetical protein
MRSYDLFYDSFNSFINSIYSDHQSDLNPRPSSPKLGVWLVSRPTVQAKNDPSFELNSPKRCRVSGALELKMDDWIDSHGFILMFEIRNSIH